MADFFDNLEDNKGTVAPTPEAIKIGDEAFTQEQLSELVGLRKMAREVEEKYNTKLDRVYPEFTKSTQRVKELEEQAARRQQDEIKVKATAGAQLTSDEIKQQAIAEADSLGLIHKGNVVSFIEEYIQGRELLNTVRTIATDAKSKGITTSDQAILEHMKNEGFRSPEKAFNDLYADKLKDWEQSQLGTIKRQGIVTENASAAGTHQPAPVSVTKSNIHQLVEEALKEEE